MTSGNAVAEVAEDAAKNARENLRRAERFANRRTLWVVSRLKPCQCCGRGVIDPAAGVTLKAKGGRSYAAGIVRCSSIWACPVCAAPIRAERAADISRGAVNHVRWGGVAYLVTLTARHYKRHQLDALMDAIQEAFKALISGAGWVKDRERLGIVGVIKSVEVTYGENGWHPHLHLVVLMGARQKPRPKVPRKELIDRATGEVTPNPERPDGWVKPKWDARPTSYFAVPDSVKDATDDDQRAMALEFGRVRARWERIWTAWLGKNGFKPNARRGIRWDRIDSVRAAQTLAEYEAKAQDGKVDIGSEMARLDLKKGKASASGDGKGLTPFELLGRLRLLREMAEDPKESAGLAAAGVDVNKQLAHLTKLWREYEEATRGRRAIEWSRDLRAAVGLDQEEKGDTEVIAEDQFGDGYARLSKKAWLDLCRRGLDLAVHVAWETGGFAGLVDFLAAVGLTATPIEPPIGIGNDDQEDAPDS